MTKTRDRVQPELEYQIAPDLQIELSKHPGKWAALTPSKIIAIRETSTEAYQAARDAGVKTPFIYPIPDRRAGYSYY